MLKKLLFKLTGKSPEEPEQNRKQPAETGIRHVRSADDGWVILKDLDAESDATFRTKREAVKEAKKVCKEKGLSLKIYKQDGSLQREHDYE
jgi:hypothetical protein